MVWIGVSTPLKNTTLLFLAYPSLIEKTPLSQQLPLKVEVLSKPPFWKFGWRFTPPPTINGGGGGLKGAHYEKGDSSDIPQ